MKKIKIRLYKKIDRDLISLYKNPDFSLTKAIILALKMSATGEAGYISLPPAHIISKFPDRIELNLQIDDEKTQEWFKKIPAGTRNDAVKNIVRGYLSGPVLCSFIGSDQYDNRSFFNSEEKPLKKCLKTKKEIIQESNNTKEKIKKAIRSSDDESNDTLSKIVKQQHEELVKQQLTQKENADTQNSSVSSETSEESDFDIFGAMQTLMNNSNF